MNDGLFDATSFPPVDTALDEPNGLLVKGGDLSPGRLLDAYRHGIFPWFNPGDPILWWSPDPRMVLVPDEVRVTRSLAKRIRNGGFDIRVDTAFSDVMRACAAPREDESGTWISPAMVAAYTRLFDMGYAHSVEAWFGGELVGG
ncbi:MAG: leucyl/phenylalanyl-tRNA--protein transferase, partial [Thiobacillus sp.]